MNGKSLKILRIALLLIGLVLFIACMFGGNDPDNGMISPFLRWSILLVIVAIVLAILLSVLFSSGSNGKRSLISAVVFIVLLVVSRLMASGDVVMLSNNRIFSNASALKLTDTLLIFSAILLVGAILVAIFGGLLKTKK